ncbi:cation-transporting ATPase [Aureococcus anophagefferens]|nr:cation-transporting ATPase [Aureococcus anophagefferens]
MLRSLASLERARRTLAAAVVNEAAGGCVGDDAAASALSDDVKRVDVRSALASRATPRLPRRPRAERVLDPAAEAPGAFAALRALGLGLAVLTGDKREVVDAVLAEIGTLAGGLGDVDAAA